jgi:hypothetical protein
MIPIPSSPHILTQQQPSQPKPHQTNHNQQSIQNPFSTLQPFHPSIYLPLTSNTPTSHPQLSPSPFPSPHAPNACSSRQKKWRDNATRPHCTALHCAPNAPHRKRSEPGWAGSADMKKKGNCTRKGVEGLYLVGCAKAGWRWIWVGGV